VERIVLQVSMGSAGMRACGPTASNNDEETFRMINIDKALLRQLLVIERPWEVREYRLDVRKHRCDVWIAQEPERGWFGRPKSAPVGETAVWQHLAIGQIRFHLHVNIPVGFDSKGLGWMGERDMPFTRALAARVFALFSEGISLQSVCSLLDLNLQHVWNYRFALDNGRAGGADFEAPTRTAMPVPAASRAVSAQDAGAVPDIADPVWLRLLSGEIKLDIKVLSLKLMLAKLRSQMDVIQDEEVRLMKLKELHRYFVKNERVLTHELNQLRLG
jgi:hypothetical protein